ncbi:unnamed protein product [Blepharisma stoltei]|uniref:Uncharacterized protein n=1 Tax=Blepharisma stoltei TaxID=1481888 RepID=A0AAU9J005_9CILI|nr:unnamed protein product [Blepharisma stoltei]
MDEPSISYSENLSTSHFEEIQSHALIVEGSMGVFNITSSFEKNMGENIHGPTSTYESIPVLPLSPTLMTLDSPTHPIRVFERLIEDVNKRNHLKKKIETFVVQREEEQSKKFKSPRKLTKDQVEDLYNRLLLDQQKRQEAQNLRQLMRESPTRELPKVMMSKKKEEELLYRLHEYAQKKKEWIEIMQEKKQRLEEEEIERLKHYSPRRYRDPNLFERLSIPKLKSPPRSLSSTRTNFVSPPRSPRRAVKTKISHKSSQKLIRKSITPPRTLDNDDISNLKSSTCESTGPVIVDFKPVHKITDFKRMTTSTTCTPYPESTRRTWCTGRASSLSEDIKTEKPQERFKLIDIDDYLSQLKAKIKAELINNKQNDDYHYDANPSLGRIFKLFPEFGRKMKQK